MADLAAIMRRLADEIEKEEAGDKSKATEDRIAELERQLKREDPTPRELTEAMAEVSDEEWELIRQHRAGTTQREETTVEETTTGPVAKKTRPGRKSGSAYGWYVDDDGKVHKADIPQVYNGADEPDTVDLPDEEEETAAA